MVPSSLIAIISTKARYLETFLEILNIIENLFLCTLKRMELPYLHDEYIIPCEY